MYMLTKSDAANASKYARVFLCLNVTTTLYESRN